jgi:hypothetical protein
LVHRESSFSANQAISAASKAGQRNANASAAAAASFKSASDRDLIAGTTTRNGLKVHAEIDDRLYPAGTKVSDEEMVRLNLRRDDFHGEWNYQILPRR